MAATAVSQAVKLKPCPFCGGEAITYEDERGDYGDVYLVIGCDNWRCGAEISDKRDYVTVKITPDEVWTSLVSKWNRRA